MTVSEILSQALQQVREQNPEITSLHLEATAYADGDLFIRYEAHVPGEQIFGDSEQELLDNIREERKAA